MVGSFFRLNGYYDGRFNIDYGEGWVEKRGYGLLGKCDCRVVYCNS